jgi:hypothetical protein
MSLITTVVWLCGEWDQLANCLVENLREHFFVWCADPAAKANGSIEELQRILQH